MDQGGKAFPGVLTDGVCVMGLVVIESDKDNLLLLFLMLLFLK